MYSLIGYGIFKTFKEPRIDSKESIPPAYVACAGILKKAESIPGLLKGTQD
jgi:hypothetical protein